jgi:hypothetical protein
MFVWLPWIKRILHLYSQQASVNGDYEWSQPHANEDTGESFIDLSLSPKRRHGRRDQRNDERSPQVPLLFYFIVISLAGHSSRDLLINFHEIPSLN